MDKVLKVQKSLLKLFCGKRQQSSTYRHVQRQSKAEVLVEEGRVSVCQPGAHACGPTPLEAEAKVSRIDFSMTLTHKRSFLTLRLWEALEQEPGFYPPAAKDTPPGSSCIQEVSQS